MGPWGNVKKKTTRLPLWLATVGLVVVLLAAGGCGDESEDASTAQVKADLLRLAYSSAVTTWDPSASFSTEVVYLANCYEPLIYANPPGSPEPFAPALATSWEVSDDGLEWTFKLREGVTFHDGATFNADAVKYSLDRTKELNLGAAYIWWPLTEVQVVDEYTVKLVLSDPVPLDRIAAASSGAWIFSPATEGKKAKWWDAGQEAGTGPWMLESYKPNEELVFVRNQDYWGGWEDNQFQSVIVKIVSEAGTQRQMLEAGEIDYAGLVARDTVESMEANPNVRIVKTQSFNSYLMFFNSGRAPLDDVRVRQALSYAVPYEDLITVGANGLGEQARGPVPTTLWPNDPSLTQYVHDPEKAKTLLAEAGVSDLKLTLTYASENPLEERFCPLIKEAFAEVGVDVAVEPLLFSQQWEKAKGDAAKRQDLFVLLWWPSYPDGYDNLSAMFRTEEAPSWNLAYWYDQEYDDGLSEAYKLSGTDVEQSKQVYIDMQQRLIDEAPAAYLFDALTVTAHQPNLKLSEKALNPNYPQVLFWYDVTL